MRQKASRIIGGCSDEEKPTHVISLLHTWHEIIIESPNLRNYSKLFDPKTIQEYYFEPDQKVGDNENPQLEQINQLLIANEELRTKCLQFQK